MWPRIILALGVVVFGLTLAAWWLLSGFGCEMNTAGCRTVRLDWSWDMVSLFLPTFVIGTALFAIGLRKMR